ncbi:MAG: spore cortex biosynthesis protein YabQ [Eubacteriales bacterium]|nr:spore cortex biosynthesis protein YabQ [Eubacteriales bacterium]
MEITTSNQLFIFGVCVLCGVAVGLLYDFFRIIRRLFKTRQTVAATQDLLFWILVCVVFFAISLNINSGEMRLYQFLGAAIGATAYFLTISKFVVRACVVLIRFAARVIIKIISLLLMPVIWFYKLIKRPLFFVINIGVKSGFRARRNVLFSLSHFNKYIKRI